MMQKFWVLSSIEKILKMDEYGPQVQQALSDDQQKYKVKVVHQAFMNQLSFSNRSQNAQGQLVHHVFG